MPPAKKQTILSKLTPKQERFCREYVVDLNGTQAAIRAGYSAKTANEQSSQLLAKLHIQSFISGLAKEQNDALELKAEDTLREIAKLAYADPGDFDPMRMASRDKLKALEMLAKHQGLFQQDNGGATAINVNVIKTAPGGDDARD